jgi:excisionase family DNA binding protein
MTITVVMPMPSSGERDFYTVAEAARELEVSETTIWRWIASQRLPAYRIGPRRIRIKQRDLSTVVRPVHSGSERGVAEDMEGERQPQDPIWANYDPIRVRQALRKSAGALAGVDRTKLLSDLRAAREQRSGSRPE